MAIAVVALLLSILLHESIAQIPCAPPSATICPGSSCCGKNGYCGVGEGYCGSGNCLSQCTLVVYPPPVLPGGEYFYYPPPELPVEEAVGYRGRHGLAWWLGIIAAVAVVVAGIILVCWLVARAATKRRRCECESSS